MTFGPGRPPPAVIASIVGPKRGFTLFLSFTQIPPKVINVTQRISRGRRDFFSFSQDCPTLTDWGGGGGGAD